MNPEIKSVSEYKRVAENVKRKLVGLPPIKPKPIITYNPESKDTDGQRYRWLENADGWLRATPVQDVRMTIGYDNPYIDDALIDHSGWYLDTDYHSETVHGVVIQLPAKGRVRRYIPAVSDPYNSGCYLADFHAMTNDLVDVVRWADRMAEQYAEEEREYQARQRAEDEAAEAEEREDEDLDEDGDGEEPADVETDTEVEVEVCSCES